MLFLLLLANEKDFLRFVFTPDTSNVSIDNPLNLHA